MMRCLLPFAFLLALTLPGCGGGGDLLATLPSAPAQAPSPDTGTPSGATVTPAPSPAPEPTPTPTPAPSPAPDATPAPTVVQGTLTLLAGRLGGAGNIDGTGTNARFSSPKGIAIDGSGKLYVASNNTIRKITPAQVVTTSKGISGSTQRLASDAAGNVYFTQGAAVRKLDADGVVSTVVSRQARDSNAGPSLNADQAPITNTGPSYTLVDGPLDQATFGSLEGIAADRSGNLFVIDFGRLRRIGADGQVRTLAGAAPPSPFASLSLSSNGSSGVFMGGVATDASGNVYAAQTNNSRSPIRILKFTPDGAASDYPGSGAAGAAAFSSLQDIAPAPDATLYVIDSGAIRKVASDGSVSTLAAPPDSHAYGGLAVDAQGNVFASYDDNTIQRITPAGTQGPWAGNSRSTASVDGSAAAASFTRVNAVAADARGNAYVLDLSSLRKVSADGAVTTLVGPEASLSGPLGVALDGAGFVYIADTLNNAIRKVSPTGTMTTLAGQPGVGNFGLRDGLADQAKFNTPRGVAVATDGTVYVADTGNALIRKITTDGVVSTFAGGKFVFPQRPVDGIGTEAAFFFPTALSIDPSGNLLVWDGVSLRKVTPAGQVTTLTFGGDMATVDAAGNVYWPAGTTIMRRRSADGSVAVVAGAAGLIGVRTGSPGSLNDIAGLAVVPGGAGAGTRLMVLSENSVLLLTLPE
jgi:sugar lactone lactonase YvrE